MIIKKKNSICDLLPIEPALFSIGLDGAAQTIHQYLFIMI